MDINLANWGETLPTILKNIEDADFISFDLEYSGVLNNNSNKGFCPEKVQKSRKSTLAERYLMAKESAEMFCVIQMGICTVTWDKEQKQYVANAYNFDVNPIIKGELKFDRKFMCSADAMFFHSQNGFNFNKLYGEGVSYLSHAEEAKIREDQRLKEEDLKKDIHIGEEERPMLDEFRQEITSWWAKNSQDPAAFLNLTPKHKDETFNGYQRRLLHQLLRGEYPYCIGLSYHRHFQIQPRNEEDEIAKKKARDQRFDDRIAQHRGLRVIVDKIMELKKPMIGHNCFGDLCYLYRTFVGALPADLESFRALIRKEFGVIIDTKFLAMYVDRSNYSEMSSSLQELLEKFGRKEFPRIDLHITATNYFHANHNHEAGYDAWSTARVFVKLATQMYVAGSDDPPQPSEESVHIEQRKRAIEEAMKTRPERKGEIAMLELEKNPSIAKIPFWESKFWVAFGGRLRVNGTIEGEFTL